MFCTHYIHSIVVFLSILRNLVFLIALTSPLKSSCSLRRMLCQYMSSMSLKAIVTNGIRILNSPILYICMLIWYWHMRILMYFIQCFASPQKKCTVDNMEPTWWFIPNWNSPRSHYCLMKSLITSLTWGCYWEMSICNSLEHPSNLVLQFIDTDAAITSNILHGFFLICKTYVILHENLLYYFYAHMFCFQESQDKILARGIK